MRYYERVTDVLMGAYQADGLIFRGVFRVLCVVVIRDTKIYNTYEKVICALVVLLFAVLAGFAFTSEAKNMKFLTIRRGSCSLIWLRFS